MRRLMQLVLLAVWLLPEAVWAQSNSIVLDLTDTRPGTYYYTIVVDGSGNATVQKIQKVVHIGENGTNPTPPMPTPSPFIPPAPVITPPSPLQPDITPPPPPVPAPDIQTVPVEAQVQDLTQRALASGGSVKTAVCLQRVYNIVWSALNTQQIAAEKTIDALHSSSDLVMEQQGEGVKWTTWRAGISSIIAEQRAQGGVKTPDQWVSLIRKIEAGIKSVVTTTITKDRSKDLTDKDYDMILKLQERIINNLKSFK